MCDNRDSFPQDHKIAVKWYRLATYQGDACAQTNLGAMHETETGLYRILFMPIYVEILVPLMGVRVVKICETSL